MSSSTLRYQHSSDALTRALRERTDAWFRAHGKSPRADALWWAKAVFFGGATVVVWAVVAFGLVAPAIALPLCLLLGGLMAAVGFNVGHDAVHRGVSDSNVVNRACGAVFDVFGANAGNWSVAHNYSHHTFTNVAGHDVDIDAGGVMRFHPHGRRRWLHRFQHLYALPLYCLAFVAWVFLKDWKQGLLRPDPRDGRRSAARVVDVAAKKLLHFGLYLGVPLACSGFAPLQVLTGYFACLLAAGLPIALVFQLPHLGDATRFPTAADDGRLAGSFAAHQLRTTANFATSSRFWSFITGGQNHQIEHHLLPTVCHTHLPALAPLVRATAAEFGLPYHCYPTFPAALAGHLRTLRLLGQP
jgi:linoleoyl-CoA desaturase